MVSAMAEGVVLIAPDGTVASCNESAERILGRRADAIVGEPVDNPVWSAIREDGSPLDPDEHPLVQAVRTGEVAQTPPVIGLVRPDGSVAWVSMTCSPLRRAAEREAYVAMATFADVTERRHAEAASRRERDYSAALVRSMQDGVSVLSPDGELVEVSPSLCAMTGFTREELVGQRAPYPYWPEATDEVLQRAFERIGAHGSAEWDLTFTRADGTSFPVIVSASVLRDAGGAVMGFMSTIKDVTERKDAEDRLLRRQAQDAALRRVATAVAAEGDPAAIFALVARDVADLLGVEGGTVVRYHDETATIVGVWGLGEAALDAQVPLRGGGLSAQVHRTGRAARMASFADLGDDPAAHLASTLSVRAGVAAPVRVGGALWGAIAAVMVQDPTCPTTPRPASRSSRAWSSWPSPRPTRGPSSWGR
jgi:PAS domain S-box-containing protein